MRKRSNNIFLTIVVILFVCIVIIYIYTVYGNRWPIFGWLPVISSVKNPLQGILDGIAGIGDSLINMITGLFH
jgi:hypothetical protein